MSDTAEPRSRGALLTVLLIIFGVMSALAAAANLALSGDIAANLPGAPDWAGTGVLLIGVLGLVGLVALFGIWGLNKWGVYLYIAVGAAVFALNMMLLGGVQPFLGLVGVAAITGASMARWRHFA